MKMKKRFLFFVIWISVMVLLFASVLTMKAFADENDSKERTLDDYIQYELWVGGVQVTSYNCHDILKAEDPATGKPTASFNPETKVLELNNPANTGNYYEHSFIYSNIPLNIKGTLNLNVNYDSYLFGILSNKNIRIFEDDTKTDIRITITVPGNCGGFAIAASPGTFTLDGGYVYLGHQKGGIDVWRGDLVINGGYLDIDSIYGQPFLWSEGDLRLSEDVMVDNPASYSIEHNGDLRYLVDENSNILKKLSLKEIPYPLWIGDRQVTKCNKDNILKTTNEGEPTASYNPATKTLVLNHPIIKGHYKNAAIYSEDALTIQGQAIINVEDESECGNGISIRSNSTLAVDEINTLTIEGEETNLVISARLEAIKADNCHVQMKSGTLNVASRTRGIGIEKHGSFLMSDGKMEISSGQEGIVIWAGGGTYMPIEGENNIIITGGTIDAYSSKRTPIWTLGRISYPDNYGAYDSDGNDLTLASNGQEFFDRFGGSLQGIRMTIEPKRPQKYGLVIGGVQVTEENADNVLGDGTVIFYPADENNAARLRLHNANIKVADILDGYAAGIYLGNKLGGVPIQTLKIELVGDNHISMPTSQLAAHDVIGIIHEGEYINIDGFQGYEIDNASLSISLTGIHEKTYGIYADILSRKKVSHDIDIIDAVVNINAYAATESCGIYCNGRLVFNDHRNAVDKTQANIAVKSRDAVGVFCGESLDFRANITLDVNKNYAGVLTSRGIRSVSSIGIHGGCVSINCGASRDLSHGIEGGAIRMYRGSLAVHASEASGDSYALSGMGFDPYLGGNMNVGDWHDFFGEGGSVELSGYSGAIDNTVVFNDLAVSLGAFVGDKVSGTDAVAWDETSALNSYKYIRVPEKKYSVTLHWSSIDGEDISGQQAIVIKDIPHGTSIEDALEKAGKSLPDEVFQKTGYQDSGYRLYAPMREYTSWNNIQRAEQVKPNHIISGDTDIYFIMGKTIDKVTLNVKEPQCGMRTDRAPTITITPDSNVIIFYSGWRDPQSDKFQGGKEYEVALELRRNFGYLFSDSVKAVINGKTVNNDGFTVYKDYTFETKIKAVHKLNETAALEATCNKPGRKPHWTCEACKKTFSDAAGTKETTVEALTVKPTGKHTWDKGKVTKNPTLTADGEMLYTCTVCKSTKKETIPKLAIDTMDIGNVWTNLSPVQGIAFTTAFDQDGKLNKQMEFADQWWQDVTKGATGGKQIHINENKLPELGHTYQFYVKIKPKKGYVFDNAKFKKFIYGGKEVAAKNYTKTLNKDGSITLTWGLKAKTVPENLNNKTLGVTVTGVVDKAYTGKAITQNPVVKAKVKGKVVTLKNGTDYTLSYKNNTAQGTATVIVTGKGKYTGTKNVSFKITHTHKWDAGKVTKQPTTAAAGVKTFTCSVCKATRSETIAKLPIKDPALRRISGGNRFKTSFAIAETYMKETKQTKLNSIIVASSTTFADALAGSYLAKSKNAPIIIWHEQLNKDVQTFIKQKVKTGGTVYILGGTVAVGDSIKQNMGGYKFVRLADRSRYGTNTKILDAGGLNKTEVLVCDGEGDGKGINALIASSAGKPLLLVAKSGLTPEQKTWLGKNKGKITKFVIVGDGKSVSTKVESELKAYGTVSRISGKNADEISAQVASTYYKNAKEVFIATMNDYPDGLCGGPLAVFAKGPILLVNEKANTASTIYVKTLTNLERATVFGGATAMPEALARKVAKNTKAKLTIIEK